MIEIHIRNRTKKIEQATITIDNKAFQFINDAAKMVAKWNSKDQNKLKQFICMLNGEKNTFKND